MTRRFGPRAHRLHQEGVELMEKGNSMIQAAEEQQAMEDRDPREGQDFDFMLQQKKMKNDYSIGVEIQESPQLSFAERVCNTFDEAQRVYRERNAVYKDNFRIVGRIMTAMFGWKQPDLVDENDFNRWHIFELFIVKLTRYVNNWHRGGHEDSLDDMIVYLGILKELDREWKPKGVEYGIRE